MAASRHQGLAGTAALNYRRHNRCSEVDFSIVPTPDSRMQQTTFADRDDLFDYLVRGRPAGRDGERMQPSTTTSRKIGRTPECPERG